MVQITDADASCHVRTWRQGLLSPVGHDLKLAVRRFTITVGGDGALEARFDASSLEVVAAMQGEQEDRRALSERDRKKIAQRVRDEVLKARHHGWIVFRAPAVTWTDDGGARVSGNLSLCGVSRAVTLEGRPHGDRLEGRVSLDLPSYTIDPPTAFLGALRVRDDVRVEFSVPRPAASGMG